MITPTGKTLDKLQKPQLIEFQKIGSLELGYISVFEFEDLISFPIKRVFWTYYTPQSVMRGGHAHLRIHQVMIATAGIIKVTTEIAEGEKDEYVLNDPNTGLYLPPLTWATMQYSHNAIQLVLCSENYDIEEYIRDYDRFQILCSKK